MTAYSGAVFAMDFPDFSPRSVSTLPQSTSIKTNITPVPSDVSNYSGNYNHANMIIGGLSWSYVTQTHNVNAWPTRKENGSYNNHQAPIGFDGAGFDWFEHVIAKPASISLGAFVTKSEAVSMYSSFRYVDIILTNIELTTGAGTSILNEPSYPATQFRQRSTAVTFKADATGAAIINGDINFIYNIITASIPVTGQRVFILPWVPEEGIKEKIEWATDIIKSVNREQRRALRASPRITRSFRFYLSEEERMEFETIAGNRGVLYTAPAWWDARYISNILAGDKTISVNTSYSEFTEGGLCLFVEPESKTFEVKTVTTVGGSTLVLNDPIENDYPSGYVVPVLPGVLAKSTLKIHNQNHYFATVEIVSVENHPRLPPEYSQLDSIDILQDRSVIKTTIPVNISRFGKLIDNGIGAVQFFPIENRPRTQEKFEWKLTTIQERFDLKDWLYSRFGRQKQFLYPTWQTDLAIYEDDYIANSGVMNVKITKMEAPFYFQVELNNGSIYRAKCTSVTKGINFDSITHTPPIPDAFTADQVDAISKIRVMRAASDSVVFLYSNHNRTSIATNLVEI